MVFGAVAYYAFRISGDREILIMDGSYIFTMVLFLLIGQPTNSFYVIAFGFNIYWIFAILYTILRLRRI
ncbi:MAG: hypothetical protein CO189_00190 [candidate division Zixibacteria bacterium CG_4_9_14_3_um_filter_46_8]|nr:MAG: hypothetical protein CO189_00190 [candidate division Zixibacteria bacterium CG_4_9_14_3_um_filter_46_8]